MDRQGNGRNRFWSGALVGALVTAFVGLIVVGMSAGIYLFGMRVMRSQPKFQPEKDGAVSITDGKGKKQEGLDYDKVTSKMNLIEDIIGQTFLYDEDAEAVEDYIYRGMLAGLDDPYSVYYSAAPEPVSVFSYLAAPKIVGLRQGVMPWRFPYMPRTLQRSSSSHRRAAHSPPWR